VGYWIKHWRSNHRLANSADDITTAQVLLESRSNRAFVRQLTSAHHLRESQQAIMFIDEVTSSGAMPALEMMVRFAGSRQRVIAHNIANIDTPNFRPMDVSPAGFQAALAEAVQRRRNATGGEHGSLEWKNTSEVQAAGDRDGGLELTPKTPSGNILFHDRNNRDLERTMQDLVENVTVFRAAVDLMRGRTELLRQAISERS